MHAHHEDTNVFYINLLIWCPVDGPKKRLNTAKLIKVRTEGQTVAKGKVMVSEQTYYVMPKE